MTVHPKRSIWFLSGFPHSRDRAGVESREEADLNCGQGRFTGKNFRTSSIQEIPLKSGRNRLGAWHLDVVDAWVWVPSFGFAPVL